jgi:hypothetical protein
VIVIVVVVGITTVPGKVAALLQAELKLLSGYPLNSAAILSTALLVTTTTVTEVELAVVIVAYSVMVETSVSMETVVCV